MPARTRSSIGLVRQLGIVSATALVISNMVGTGIFSASGFTGRTTRQSPFSSSGIWVVGALCAFGSFCYSELGINYPSSGGEYVYLTRAYGPTWGFMTGWISFFAGFSAPIAAAALAFSDYLGYFFPGVKQANPQIAIGSGTFAFKFGGAQAVACALIAFFTLINCLGALKKVARIQNALTGTKVVVLLMFIVLALLVGNGSWSNFSMHATRTSTIPVASQFAISLFWIYVSYSGWNAATYVAEELQNPARTLPLSLTIGTLLVAALYIVLNVVFIYGAPCWKR